MSEQRRLLLVLVMVLSSMLVFACAEDDEDESSPTDTANNNGTDSGGDTTANDSDSTVATCGGAQAACCAGNVCNAGLDPVMGLSGACTCQPACSFAACTAGTTQGYCTNMFMLESLVCYNEVDLPAVVVNNDCTVGAACTTDTGVTTGICVSLPDPGSSTGAMVNRCAMPCDGAPTACPEGTACSPAMSLVDGNFAIDYTSAHCSLPMM
ncbi:MAG: hypothetical protein JXX14_05415 [Deltaproteobacteria bacterium]|nr:hypothetical protein [Deltaproteobacteria bacterium]